MVDLGRYLAEVSGIGRAGMGRRTAKVQINADPIVAGLSLAVPLGLIVNEILSATQRYAFPETAWIQVSLVRIDDGRAELLVAGNGRPLPAGFDPEADSGLMLADALASQLAATLDTEIAGNGTTTRLTFPL
jgi:two-component sensor histidine kinase